MLFKVTSSSGRMKHQEFLELGTHVLPIDDLQPVNCPMGIEFDNVEALIEFIQGCEYPVIIFKPNPSNKRIDPYCELPELRIFDDIDEMGEW